MFERLARLVVHRPWVVIALWVAFAGGVVCLAPSLGDVVAQDQSNFLPSDDESARALALADAKFGQGTDPTAVLVVHRTDGSVLSDADQSTAAGLAERIRQAHIPRVTKVSTGPQSVSPNKKIQMVTVVLHGVTDDSAVTDGVKEVRKLVGAALEGTGLQAPAAGDAPSAADTSDAFARAMTIVAVATVVLIIVLVLLMFRSPIAAVFPVAMVGLVSLISPGVIAAVAKAFDFEVDQSLSILVTIVLYGVGTDYIVFLLFRYREHLRAGQPPEQALITASTRISEVIASAAAAIVIAFSALGLASFGGFRSFGPGLAIPVVVMALAATTLVPAVVSLLGPRVFWPSRSWRRESGGTAYRRLGEFTARRPALVAASTVGVLGLLALSAFGLHNDYHQGAGANADTESARARKVLETGLPAGALGPTTIYVQARGSGRLDAAALEAYAVKLQRVPGVGGVLPGGRGGEAAQLSEDGTVAKIDLLLRADAYSSEALDLASGPLRRTAHAEAPAGTTAYVGGISSVFSDIRDATTRDLKLIFPVAAVLIALILALLLRSLVAPVYLMIAVVLNFASTLGAAVLAFQHVLGRDGLMFSLPTLLYLFVVAVGTDYNILIIARLREESRAGNSPRAAARRAIEHGGPSIGAAGMILAGTFASATFAGITFLAQMGFSVSVGILLSSLVMATVLVPAVTALFGAVAWWPGRAGTTPAVRPAPPVPVGAARE